MISKKLRLIIVAALILVLGSLTTITVISCRKCSNTEYVTISFETGEGSKIDAIEVEKGSKVKELPSPSMTGATFESWYYNSSLTNQFSYDDVIDDDLTLYANYEIDINNLNVNESTQHFEENCDKTMQVTVIAKRGLSKEQFLNNISIEGVTGDLPKFDVNIAGTEYTIIPLQVDGASQNGYEPGKMYKITIPGSYQFKDLETNVKEYTFRIHKDAVMYAEVNSDIKYMLSDEIISLQNQDENTYVLFVPELVFKKYTLEVNDIISISKNYLYDEEGNLTLDTDNATVVKIIGYSKMETGEYMVDAVQAKLGEMFKDVDVGYVQTIPVEDIINTIKEADVEKELENSEGVKKMSKVLATSIANSTSVKKALGKDDFTNNTYLIEDTIKEILIKFKDVKITVKVGEGHNPNFDNALIDDFCVISFNFQYEATVKKKIKIKAELELTQYIALTMQGDSDFSLKDLYLRFDYAFNVYSQTEIDLTVLMCSIDKDDEEYKDISKEISDKLSNDDDDNSNLITELQDMLDNDSGDIELMTVPIIKTSIPVIPIIHVFDVNTKLNFVIKINFGAGINIDASVLEAVQIGAKGDTDTGNIESFKYELPGGDQYSLELSACGYLGIKIGFEASLTISFCGASKFGEVGLAVFVGPYVDLYGYVKMSLSRVGYVPSKYVAKAVKSEVIGGYYIEIGINVQVELIARSDFFKVKAGVDLLNYKIPIVTFGSKDVLYDIVEQEEQVILMNDSTNSDKYTIDYRNFIYAKGKFLDITTGKTSTKDISYNKLHMTFDNRCFSYDNIKGVIIYDRTKDKKAYTNECTVTMYYTDSYLMFNSNASNTFERCPAGTVKLIWTDTNVVSEESAGKTFNASIKFIIDGDIVEERTQPIRAGNTLGYIPNSYSNGEYTNGFWNYDSFTEIITGDIEFIYTAQTRLVYVAFMYYDMEKCKWKMEVRCVKLGETPVAPDIQTESEKVHFRNWTASTGTIARRQSISSLGVSPVISVDYLATYGSISDMFITGYESNDLITSWDGDSYSSVYYQLMDERTPGGSAYYYITVHIYIADYIFDDCTLSVVFPDDINQEKNHNYDLTVPYGATYLNYQLYYIMPDDRTFIGYSLNKDLSDPFSLTNIPKITSDTTLYFVYGYKDFNIKLNYYDDLKDEYILYDEEYTYAGMDNLNELMGEVEKALVKEPGVTYEFCGWINKYNNKYTKLTEVTGDLELYPNYIRTYDITFDPNGGELLSLSVKGNTITTSSRLFNGKNSTLLEIKAVKEDEYYQYEFLGWEDENKNKYDAYFSYEFSGPTILKAIWGEPIEKTYSVTVVADRAVLLNGQNIDYYEGNYEGYLEFIKKYRTYHIPDIYDEENGLKVTYNLVESTINSAEYVNYLNFVSTNEYLQYVLTINANGGELTTASINALVATGVDFYPIEYLGTYKDDNNNNIYQFKYYYGRCIELSKLKTEKANTLRATYRFDSYLDSKNNNVYHNNDDIVIKSDITLTVNWIEELLDYTITYYVNDKEIKTEIYHYNDEIEVLSRPNETMKYKWSGWIWYIGETTLNSAPTKMTNDNYVVKSTTEEVKVIYLLDGKVYNEMVVDANSIITLIDKYQKEGYEVSDWITENVIVINNTFTMPEDNVIFTSTTKKATYKVTYLDLNSDVYASFEHLYGDTISLIDLPSSEDGKYYAWVSDDVAIIGSTFTVPAQNITIKLIVSNQQYRLIYVVNNLIVKYEYVMPMVTKEVSSTLFDGEFEGEFSGWYSKDVDINNDTITTIEKDIYLYGYYTTGKITVNVYLDDSDEISFVLYGNSGDIIKGYNYYQNNETELNNEILIKLYNHNISGWSINENNELSPSIILDRNIETINIKAYYEKKYKVSYDINDLGNYNESFDELEETYKSEYHYAGEKVYLKALPTLKEYEYRSNYYMLEWFTIHMVELNSDENGTYFIMPEYDLTFNTTEYYAVEEDNTYLASIYIKLPDTTEQLYCKYTVDETTQFSAVTPSIDGYYCVCLKDEEGNEYENGAYINFDIMGGKNKKFTAIYEAYTQQIAMFRVNGKVVKSIIYDSYLGGYIPFPTIKVDDGFKLLGWFNDEMTIPYEYIGIMNYIYIEKELLGRDFIFDAVLINDLSNFNLNISFGNIDESSTLLYAEYNYELEMMVINIVEGTTLIINNQYVANTYDIELYLSIDSEHYENITFDYLKTDGNLVYISIPSIEEIYKIFKIENLEMLTITINFVLQ